MKGNVMFKAKLFFILLVCLPASFVHASLIAQYSFEGNLEDVSGNGHHAVQVGSGGTVIDDPVRGQVFSNTSSYLDLEGTAALPHFPANSSITLTAWAKQAADPGSNYAYIIQVGQNGDNPITSMGIHPDGRIISYAETSQPGGNLDQVNSYSSVSVEAGDDWAHWHHLAVVYDRTTDIVTFYIDGEPAGTNSISKLQDTYPFNWTQGRIGGDIDGPPYYQGLVDDARIYDHALSASEIAALYESTKAIEYTADFDHSDNVNLADYCILANTWQKASGQAGYNEACDLVDNDMIDVEDLMLFSMDWLWEVPSVWTQTARAGTTDVNPGWSLSGPVSDIAAGSSYYYVKNNRAAAIISTIKAVNNGTGTLQKGFVADFVNREINIETLDWTQFLLNTSMGTTWDEPTLNLSLDSVAVDGNSIIASGQWNGNPDILAGARYTMLDNAPILKITVTLTNTGISDFNGYLEYQLDPDSSDGQSAYTPGIGWAVSSVSTSGWTANYIYDGPNGASVTPAHGIAWYENTPTGVLTPGYIFGAWFEANIPAGSSTDITMYHISDFSAGAVEPYANIAYWASRIPELDMDVAGMGFVKGRVVDSVSGEPISGANVIAKNILAETVGNTATDGNGDYTLILPVDVYTLTVSSLYHNLASRSVSMVQGQPSVLDFDLDPVTVWAGAGKKIPGGLSEGGDDALVMVNQQMAMSVAVSHNDGQLPGSTKGKPVDMAIKGLNDGIDWINLPYISLTQPAGTEGWQVITVANDTVEIISQDASHAVVRTTGVYSEVPGVTVETYYTMNAGESWVNAETLITNTTAVGITVWVGDVIDNDESGQTSHVPGIGDITAGYDYPAEYVPTAPWIAQYGSSSQCFGIIYLGDTSGMTTYGNSAWIQSRRQVTIPAGESVSMERLVICTSTEGYVNKADAIEDIYQNELAGIASTFALDREIVTGSETATATVTLTNNSEAAFENCTATLVLPDALQTSDPLTVNFANIAVGATANASWTLSGVSGGTALVTVIIDCGGAVFSKSDSIFVNGPGWYAGDNHTHSTYSDGSGTIAQNYASAQSKGLSFVTSTDHNSINQQADVYAYSTSTFLGLLGDEVTSSYGHSLAYNIDKLINHTLPPQQMIDQVIACNAGQGLLYIAHPYYPGLEWDDHTVTGYTGIEVWNGFYGPTHSVNAQAFAMWDNFNLSGMHLYGIANSDAHNINKISDPHIRAWLDSLTRENIILALATGRYYGTNGPSLDFAINGVMMGGDVSIGASSATVTIAVSGSHTSEITSVSLIKNGVSLQEWTPAAVSMNDTVQVTASAGDFYRLVVQTANGGYAFSNPIWIVE